MKRRNFFAGLTAAVVASALELRLAAAALPSAPRFNIEELLQQEATRIGEDIHIRFLSSNPWINLIPRTFTNPE